MFDLKVLVRGSVESSRTTGSTGVLLQDLFASVDDRGVTAKSKEIPSAKVQCFTMTLRVCVCEY